MPSLNFQPRFAPLVESGEKTQTIRAYRKDGRDPKVGDTLYLYTGMRTKKCRKLGEGVVKSVRTFEIKPPGFVVDGKFLGLREARKIAQDDGFEDAIEMAVWFAKFHGLPFAGLLIRWRKTA